MTKCIGCKKEFNRQGFPSHKKSCKDYKREIRVRLSNVADYDGPGQSPTEDVGEPAALVQLVEVQIDEVQRVPTPEREPTPPQEYRKSGLPHRKTKLPKRFQDILPPRPPVTADPVQVVETPQSSQHELEADIPTIPSFKTNQNSFGVYRIYKSGEPSFNPDDNFRINGVADGPNFTNDSTSETCSTWASPFGTHLTYPDPSENHETIATTPTYLPFKNMSIFRLMQWFYDSSLTKSLRTLNDLVHQVLLAPDFNSKDLAGFDAAKEARRLDNFQPSAAESTNTYSRPERLNDGWIETSVPISLPCDKVLHQSDASAPVFKVKGLLYRKPLEVIKAAFHEPSAEQFHISPFEEYWKPSPKSPPERIYSELYNSNAYVQEQEKIRSQPRSESKLETVIAPLMLWSDSTHLTNFGNASLWPIYLYLGSQSKYTRAKPSSFAAHHLAYIPKLNDSIQDFYKSTFGKAATADTLTHLRRELMHAVWCILLDDEFTDAYANGTVITFPDGIQRHLFPRFFTYSADYPEKVLLCCIKFLGNLPCPRCLVHKSEIQDIGRKRDLARRETRKRVDDDRRRMLVETARDMLYQDGVRPGAKAISNLLASLALIPTRNAFSERLSQYGFDFHSMFAVDLMHEFELGVWKAVFTHLLRILYAQGGDGIQKLNERYREIPTFGRDTIRKFVHNASGMKKLAARDFEDLLQCAIPVFDGLFDPSNNVIIMDLLFELATWHALAKLRLHTESTVCALETSTTRLGMALRKFQSKMCAEFLTQDLPSEEAARGRRKAAKAKLGTSNLPKGKKAGKQKTSGAQFRSFNLSTYKTHALSDYAKTIRMFGTSDGYSTQTGELEHRRCKRFYPRVHKGKFAAGIAREVYRERILQFTMKQQNLVVGRLHKKQKTMSRKSLAIPFSQSEHLPPSQPNQHYQISDETRHSHDISRMLGKYYDDPATMDFIPRLKDFALCKILNQEYDFDEVSFSEAQRASVTFVKNKIYQHKVLRINYTTYDMRREQDSLNPRTHANIMVLSQEQHRKAHPYWYARIIGIYHTLVRHESSPDPIPIYFLWIRWYGLDLDRTSRFGWKMRRLPKVGFVPDRPDAGSPAFGFLDPAQVIRGVHLIPSFSEGLTSDLLEPSLARLEHEGDLDWRCYYVNIFVDRDMFMRFRGGGVGHKSTREATDKFLHDRNRLDVGPRPMEDDLEMDGPNASHDEEEPEDENSGDEDDLDRDNESGHGAGSENGAELEGGSEDDHEEVASAGAGSDESEDDLGFVVNKDQEDYGYSVNDEDEEDEANDEVAPDFADDELGPEDGEGDGDEMYILGFAAL